MVMIEAGLRRILIGDVIESLIRFGLIGFLLYLCIRYFSPFADLVIWALILAVALSPLHLALAKRMNGRMASSATIIVLLGIAIIGLPTALIAMSIVDPIHQLQEGLHNGSLRIDPPPASVADWPVIGSKIFDLWQQAANNLSDFMAQYKETIKSVLHKLVSALTGTIGALFVMLGALIISGIMMAYTHSASSAFDSIFSRITDPTKGPKIKGLCVATIRSVAVGVLGVAFIQAVLVGIGFFWAGLATAGFLTVLVFFIGILQLPALILTIPVIAYLWSGDASSGNLTLVTIYLVIAGFSDHILKPMLLGRGVDVPMVVILIGAIGGMITSGMIGLFIGGVVLAVGYQLFMEWVHAQEQSAFTTEISQNNEKN